MYKRKIESSLQYTFTQNDGATIAPHDTSSWRKMCSLNPHGRQIHDIALPASHSSPLLYTAEYIYGSGVCRKGSLSCCIRIIIQLFNCEKDTNACPGRCNHLTHSRAQFIKAEKSSSWSPRQPTNTVLMVHMNTPHRDPARQIKEWWCTSGLLFHGW